MGLPGELGTAVGRISDFARLVALAAFAAVGTKTAVGQPNTAAQKPAGIHFDVPAQALEDALYTFGATAGIEVFVDGSLVQGRHSAQIKGAYSPQEALQLLLAGTGLEAHVVGERAMTLSLPHRGPSNSLTYRGYSAALQSAVLRQLCGESVVRPGTYRVAMQLWLSDAGSIRRVELLSSTGDASRDRRIRMLLHGISIEKPPLALPQPITMVILPRSQEESGDCAQRR